MLGACTPKQSRRFFSQEAAAFVVLASPLGEAVSGPDHWLMRGKSAIVTRLRAATKNLPLIRPCGATAPLLALRATSPVSGESVPKGEGFSFTFTSSPVRSP